MSVGEKTSAAASCCAVCARAPRRLPHGWDCVRRIRPCPTHWPALRMGVKTAIGAAQGVARAPRAIGARSGMGKRECDARGRGQEDHSHSVSPLDWRRSRRSHYIQRRNRRTSRPVPGFEFVTARHLGDELRKPRALATLIGPHFNLKFLRWTRVTGAGISNRRHYARGTAGSREGARSMRPSLDLRGAAGMTRALSRLRRRPREWQPPPPVRPRPPAWAGRWEAKQPTRHASPRQSRPSLTAPCGHSTR